jgi:hypothetical protein
MINASASTALNWLHLITSHFIPAVFQSQQGIMILTKTFIYNRIHHYFENLKEVFYRNAKFKRVKERFKENKEKNGKQQRRPS